MLRIFVLLCLVVPVTAGAEMWRWLDAGGRIHYSNVPSHIPREAEEIHGRLGFLTAAPVEAEPTPVISEEELTRMQAERRLRRRLAEIEAFYQSVRTQQRRRLESWPVSTILPDWVVADHWMSVKEEEAKVRAALADLERRRPPS